MNKLKQYFVGQRLNNTKDVFEKAKINLVFNFTFFLFLLAIPFIIQLYFNGYWYHFSINIFEIITLLFIFFLFKTSVSIKFIGMLFVFMDSIMCIGSLVFQNGNFEIQAGLWSLLLIIYTFFVLGKKWGFTITLLVVLLFLGSVPIIDSTAILNFELSENQIIPTAPAFLLFPFILNIYIITVIISTNITAQSLIHEQKSRLEEQKNEIISSINYAKRIQQAKLPTKEEIKSLLPDSFILFKPKDIVSGDFYYFNKTKEDIIIAVADCTGHGVPGAILSMICYEKLDEVCNQCTDASLLLNLLNKSVKKSLKQTESDDSTRDGMDIALCKINLDKQTLSYSGANRPIWIIRKDTNEIEEIKATKKAIGGFTHDDQLFETTELQLSKGDIFYIFSDGYADQFNEQTGKKLMTKKLKELLLQIKTKPMYEQKSLLENTFLSWKGTLEQIDDVTVIGVKI